MAGSVLKAVVSAAVLAGCVTALDAGKTRSHPVMGGAVMVGVPTGYCVDAAASTETPDGSIVLMGRCVGKETVPPAIISVSVGQPGSAGVMSVGGKEMAEFFRSPAGLSTLSARNQPADVRLVEALASKGAFLMRLQDRDKGDYWRAAVGTRGRLVTLSVTGVQPQGLSVQQGRNLLDQTLEALRRANKS